MDARIDTQILNGGRGLALRRPPPRSTLRRALGIADEGQQLEALSELEDALLAKLGLNRVSLRHEMTRVGQDLSNQRLR